MKTKQNKELAHIVYNSPFIAYWLYDLPFLKFKNNIFLIILLSITISTWIK